MCEALLVIYDDNEFLNTFPLIKSREVNVFFSYSYTAALIFFTKFDSH